MQDDENNTDHEFPANKTITANPPPPLPQDLCATDGEGARMPAEAASMDRDTNARAVRRRLSEGVPMTSSVGAEVSERLLAGSGSGSGWMDRQGSGEVEGCRDVGWRRRAALEEPTASDADDSVHEDSDDNGDVARGGPERRYVSGVMWALLQALGGLARVPLDLWPYLCHCCASFSILKCDDPLGVGGLRARTRVQAWCLATGRLNQSRAT